MFTHCVFPAGKHKKSIKRQFDKHKRKSMKFPYKLVQIKTPNIGIHTNIYKISAEIASNNVLLVDVNGNDHGICYRPTAKHIYAPNSRTGVVLENKNTGSSFVYKLQFWWRTDVPLGGIITENMNLAGWFIGNVVSIRCGIWTLTSRVTNWIIFLSGMETRVLFMSRIIIILRQQRKKCFN